MTRKILNKLVVKPVLPSDEVLRTVSDIVSVDKIKTTEIQNIIDALLDFSYGEKGDIKRRTMVGVSAPQFGILKRISIIDVIATGQGGEAKLQEFINPEIISKSDETEEGREGCFSTDMVCGIVERSKSVIIRGYNRKGELVENSYVGFPARIFQHEIDHLNGICFPDRITDDSKLHWVESDEFGDYRINWKTWQKKCSRQSWEAIKYGKDLPL